MNIARSKSLGSITGVFLVLGMLFLLLGIRSHSSPSRSEKLFSPTLRENPDSGPHYVRPSEARGHFARAIAACPGLGHYAQPRAEVLYGHFSQDPDLVLSMVNSDVLRPEIPTIDNPHVVWRSFSVNGAPAVGYQWDGRVQRDATGNVTGWADFRSYVAWSKGGTTVQLGSYHNRSLGQLQAFAARCTMTN